MGTLSLIPNRQLSQFSIKPSKDNIYFNRKEVNNIELVKISLATVEGLLNGPISAIHFL